MGPDIATRERDILLAPNEYAYVQDLTKGVIDLYVGATKISLSNTERLVNFNSHARRFIPLEEKFDESDSGISESTGVQPFVEASSSQYIILGNPPKEEAKHVRGSNQQVELQTGRKVVIPGPATFPLWPGQVASVIDGHSLREDEYLLIRAYDTPFTPETKKTQDTSDNKDAHEDIPDGVEKKENIQIGMEQIVRGSETRFYVPQNGFEVVPAKGGGFVRKAIKLMDGEYCVLLRPNGERKYVNGPNMVIPEPEETIQTCHDRQVLNAHALKPEKGLHLCVTKDFTVGKDDLLAELIGEGDFKIGQELFIQSKDGLFFPNENLEIKGEVLPISLAEDEGVYVRDTRSGEIKTVKGPKNFLPVPIREEIVERDLDSRVARLYGLIAKNSNGDFEQNTRERRKAVSVYVPPNHAVMATSEKGRKVVKGPVTHILDYSEDLETLALSTDTPKTDKKLLETVFLQIEGNKVSDLVTVETHDHVNLEVKVSYRISFEGEPEKWFDVNNYVGLLCDHLSSLVRSAVQRQPLETFYSSSTDIVRDTVLGEKKEGEQRAGRKFEENGMHVYDLEVLSIDVLDDEVRNMLASAQQNTFQMEMDKRKAERRFDLTKSTEGIAQETNALKAKSLESEQALFEKEERLKTVRTELAVKVDKISKVGGAENRVEADRVTYELRRTEAEEEQRRKIELLAKETEAYQERMGAVTPELANVLTRFGDQQLIARVSENLGQLSVLEGKAPYDLLKFILRGGLLGQKEGVLESLEPVPEPKKSR